MHKKRRSNVALLARPDLLALIDDGIRKHAASNNRVDTAEGTGFFGSPFRQPYDIKKQQKP